MTSTSRFRRPALLVVAAVLLLLVGIVTFGSWLTNGAAGRAQRYVQLNEAYQRAGVTVLSEESGERKYLLEPDATARATHLEAERALDAAMRVVLYEGNAADRALASEVITENRRYVKASSLLFAARDRNASPTEMAEIDNTVVQPIYAALQQRVSGAAAEHQAKTLAVVDEMRRTGRLVLYADIATLVVSVVILVLFGRSSLRYQRDLRRQSSINEHQAMHDALTGLPNRLLFQDRAEQAVARAARSHADVAVLVLDLDRFKEVNDTLGHSHGDLLLIEVAKRLPAVLRDCDTVARLGGDEFAVLLDAATVEGAIEVADRITGALQETFVLDGVALDLEASIGIAVGRDQVADLLRRGDVAMYEAKDQHRPYAVYAPERESNTPARLALLGDLRRALSRENELSLHYQPKIDAVTGEVRGVEGLLRWAHPTRGPVPPDAFIPVAENTGLIEPLTLHVVKLALRQQQVWMAAGRELPIAVNISARNLLDLTFPDVVERLLRDHGVPPRLLMLELTESSIMSDPARAMGVLHRLSNQGIRIAIDDFGTGYSSMSYLKELPVAELKIDRSFVTDLPTDGSNAVLVQSAVDLGHNLGLSVVAEGVEDEQVLERLRAMGCDIAQGFHIGRPVTAVELEGWLSRRAAAAAAGLPVPAVPTLEPAPAEALCPLTAPFESLAALSEQWREPVGSA